MEIEFQNDYTVNNCLYATPKWTFETIENKVENNQPKLTAVSNITSINNIPIPNGLSIKNSVYIGKPFIYFENTSLKKKILI